MVLTGTVGRGMLASQSSFTGPMLIVLGIVAVAWGLYEWLRADKKPDVKAGRYR